MPVLTYGFSMPERDALMLIDKVSEGDIGNNYFFFKGFRVDLLKSGDRIMFTHTSLVEHNLTGPEQRRHASDMTLTTGVDMVYQRAIDMNLQKGTVSALGHHIF